MNSDSDFSVRGQILMMHPFDAGLLEGAVMNIQIADHTLVVLNLAGAQSFLLPGGHAKAVYDHIGKGRVGDALYLGLARELGITQGAAVDLVMSELAHLHAAGLLIDPPEAAAPGTVDIDLEGVVMTVGPRAVHFQTNAPELLRLVRAIAPRMAKDRGAAVVTTVAQSQTALTTSSQTVGALAAQNIAMARGQVLVSIIAEAFGKEHPLLHGTLLRSPSGKIILLGGDSGQGKSTLGLGLQNRGYTLLSDDLCVFDADTGQVTPIPFAASVKEGSWAIFENDVLQLADRPAYQIGDRRVKYVPLDAEGLSVGWCGIDSIIIPQWSVDGHPGMRREANFETILNVLKWSHLPKDEAAVQALVDMISGVPISYLAYRTFEQADEAIMAEAL